MKLILRFIALKMSILRVDAAIIKRKKVKRNVYSPKPTSGRRSQSRKILESIRQMSEKMLQPTGETEEEDIFAEMEDALDSLIFRWNTCLQNNPELCLSGLEGIRRIGEQGMEFIKNFEQSIREANAG